MSQIDPDQQAYQQQDQNQQEQQEESQGTSRFLLFTAVPSWMVSMIIHAVLLIILMFFTMPDAPKKVMEVFAQPEEEQEVEEVEDVEIQPVDTQQFEDAQESEEITPLETLVEEVTEIEEISPNFEDVEMAFELNELADLESVTSEIATNIGAIGDSGVSSRSASNKAKMVREAGGNAASEEAVARALRWIANHQLPDGGWNFDHRIPGGSKRGSPNPGTATRARNGATAMALLPFLGAGQTHLEGQYKETVRRGLNYLIVNQKAKAGGGSFYEPEGSFYSHGLASIVLCEAFAMTKDTELSFPAQASLNYIVYAQDPVGGGWRYQAHQPGDTSVVGWQLMALKSGHMGYLEVPNETMAKAARYLDTVSAGNGAFYGYTEPNKSKTTTSIGLLCRMYMGWKQNHPGLKQGVEFLSKTGPDTTSKANMYYNYYATQVLRHYGGDTWKKWNEEMRDFLVKEQSKKGVSTGSWHFDHHHGNRGGRLYNTALSTMVLEVYYRHMPIYGAKISEDDFELE